MRFLRFFSSLLAAIILSSSWTSGGELIFSPVGELVSACPRAVAMDVATDLSIYLPGWKAAIQQKQAKILDTSRTDGIYKTHGVMTVQNIPVDFIQTAEILPESIYFRLQVKAAADVDAEAVIFSFTLPSREYQGGALELFSTYAQRAVLPERPLAGGREKRQAYVLSEGEAQTLTLTAAGARSRFHLRLPKKTYLQVHDARHWQYDNFVIFVQMHRGNLEAGRTYTLETELTLERDVEKQTAQVMIDAAKTLYPFAGFGGNYCFQIDNPLTRFHLQTLRSAWARTEVSIHLWEPENDNTEVNVPRWDYYYAQDVETSKLRAEFLMGQTLAQKKIPFIASIWYLPEWLLENPGMDKETTRRRLPRKNWPEFAEALITYLQYAKKKYGWEPAMFSFNEPDVGVKIRFTAAEHAELIKFLGDIFTAHGIQTKFLLGDTATAANALTYWPSALADAEALRYVAGVSYHTWGRGTPDIYRKLAALAQQAQKPIFLGEVGTDAGAWVTGAFRNNWKYALGEIELYLNLLNHAAPYAMLQWQFSNDYALSEEMGDKVNPGKRYWVMKQFCNWTPQGETMALAVRTTPATVAAAAFGDPGKAKVVHIANYSTACRATISGLDPEADRAVGVVTGYTDSYRYLDDLQLRNGTIELELPAQSLTTLRVE